MNILNMDLKKAGLHLIALLICLFTASFGVAQIPYGIFDGRDGDLRCESCEKSIAEKPAEVLFGVDIHGNGDVYFSMNNKQWFDKIFSSPASGISVDIVTRDRYNCSKPAPTDGTVLRGYLLRPVYKDFFKQNMKELQDGHVMIKIGTLPFKFLNKEIEGSLVILNGAAICYYTNFVNIDRSVWQLLPMGLYADTLVRSSLSNNNIEEPLFTYTKKLQTIIPFEKGKADYSDSDIRYLYDSLKLQDNIIRRIEIRAYSSIEGSENVNKELMKKRADVILKALKQFQPGNKSVRIITAENWLDFFDDIKDSEFEDFSRLSKVEIKRKLMDKTVSEKIEPILSNHRKVVITVYLNSKTGAEQIPESSLISEFNRAIRNKDISRSRIIQNELVSRIADNKLPDEYLNQLEMPMSRDYLAVLNDREIYRYLLKNTSEYEALENFKELKKLDPTNGRVNYNICALKFFLWQYGDSSDIRLLLQDLNDLEKQRIDKSLVKRMLINYHILKCGEYMASFKYREKDQALLFIKNTYPSITLTDEEIYSLAKYFSSYSHSDWAEQIIKPRVNKIDVSEDIVFYYVNLGFYHPSDYDDDNFHQAMLNAVNLNRERFCEFFMPTDRGGAGMQLLESEELKSVYCESCSQK